MPLRDQENEIFDRWRKTFDNNLRKSFVTDGAVDQEAYSQSKLKILFLLKEVNDQNGGGWCLREFLAEGGRSQTWDTVTRWLRAMRNLSDEITWDDLKEVKEDQRRRELQSIAAMNLKKIPGGHTTNPGLWRQAVECDQEYIWQQFALYKADLVICCGSMVASAYDFIIGKQRGNAPQWQRTSRGVDYHEYERGKFVIAYSHPEARVAPNLIHFGLVDAVRSIRIN